MVDAPATDLVRSQFGAVAAAYVTSSYHASGPDLSALVQAARLGDNDDVLDLGCGAGHAALAVAPHAARVTAIDVTAEMVGVAERLAAERAVRNVTFRVGDVAALPFPDATFDVVVSRVAAHHFADPLAALSEAVRVLRPDGRLAIIDTVAPEDPAIDTFLNCVEVLRDASHVRNWRTSEWLAMLGQAGFVHREVVDEFPLALDGQEWVERMRTPPARVAMIKKLFEEATSSQRQALDLRTAGPWGLTIRLALFRASKS
jgi:SAM-dependent methyltransferase